jgi:hypothetical protein
VASLSSLADRVRVELGDVAKSFVEQFMADGTTNRFNLHHAPLDGEGVVVLKDGIDISDQCSVEESTGTLVIDEVPADGQTLLVSGIYYRYFTAQEMYEIVRTAVLEHSASRTDSMGQQLTVENLPQIEEYPVVIYATTLGLYTLATDASFDINIFAPDGVTIPRSERYRQLMEMVQARQQQYKELCVLLGIGLYSIEVFTVRKISKRTNRYVPIYKPQEVDDKSFPQRVDLPLPSYGNKSPSWPTEAGEFLAYQGRSFSTTVEFEGNYEDAEFVARLLRQRGGLQIVQNFALSVINNQDGTYTATLSLTKNQTLRLARRNYWSLAIVDPEAESGFYEIKGGNFFTDRVSEVIL